MAKVGFTAPDFRLKNIKGEFISLESFRSKVVLVNFWATWCAPCRAEMPSMEELYRHFNRKDFEILAVSSDEDGLRSVKPFQEEYQFTFPILIDETLQINDLYGVSSIPTSIIVDRNGIITNRFFGAVDWNDPRQRDLVDQMIKSPS
ncbi:MAG: TlpA family protein disulfide reductase [Nitrospirae bacterium]|nr:TlpA family protein disulfide reductase [Nitrospirota bacterium]MBI3353155.1 TlpA family protein disulfide reductase [Nitrospirota bacterium]